MKLDTCFFLFHLIPLLSFPPVNLVSLILSHILTTKLETNHLKTYIYKAEGAITLDPFYCPPLLLLHH